MNRNTQYKLQVRTDTFDAIKEVAEQEGMTIAELLRRGIKWELLVHGIRKDGGRVFIQKKDEDKPVEVIPF